MLTTLLMSACVSKKKLSSVCAELYPPLDSVSVRYETVSDTVVSNRWLVVRDTTICVPSVDTIIHVKTKTVEVPMVETITIRTSRDTTIYTTNTAMVDHLRGEYRKLNSKYKSKSETVDKLRKATTRNGWIIAALLLVIIGYIALRIIKKLS